MTLNEKILELQRLLCYESVAFVRDSLDKVDFKVAIVNALRKISGEAKILEKIVFIPIVENNLHNQVVLSNLTEDKIDFTKLNSLHVVNYSDGTIRAMNIEKTYLEKIIGQFWQQCVPSDYYHYALRFLGTNLYATAGEFFGTHEGGIYTTAGVLSSQTVFSVSPDLTDSDYKYLFNLSTGDISAFPKCAEITNWTSPIEVSSMYNWAIATGNKLYASKDIPNFIVFNFQAVPSLDYFSSYSTVIPIQPAWETYINDLSLHYLYSILIQKKKEMIRQYDALIKTGSIRMEKDILSEIRRRSSAARNADIEVQAYQPFGINENKAEWNHPTTETL